MSLRAHATQHTHTTAGEAGSASPYSICRGAHAQRALGLGGGSRPTGVLVQRWVQQESSGGYGAQPREIFFTILMDF